MKIALCGNPNVGKTTLFNRLTHSDEPVGNWHGVTVDVRTKRVTKDILLSDLPGAYSLTPRTAEERITRDSILFGDFDAVVYVAEVNNLRRNLYMFMQIVEAGKPLVLVVNMMDEARGKTDLSELSRRLGVPVVGTSNRAKDPKHEITAAVQNAKRAVTPDYVADRRVTALRAGIGDKARTAGLTPTFAALKLCECDADVAEKLCGECTACADRDVPAQLRYGYIDKILTGAVERGDGKSKTPAIDRIVLGKAALPLFFAVMTAVFVIVFEAGKPLSDMLSGLTGLIARPVRAADMPKWLSSLISDGVIAGIGATLSFLPQVVLMFVLTALLQDSGYMSRVAFLTDDFFKKFGLSGRAAFSVVMGLGCSATAVLTTRGIAGERRRRRAAFAAPFCPCSARLAVFTAVCAYFGLSGLYVAAMYVLGFAVMLAVLKVSTLFGHANDCDDGLIMEMPPYRVPSAKRVLSVVLHNISAFVLRVGSVVLLVSVIMWALCNLSVANGFIPGGGEKSIMSTFAGLISPVFTPLGFGNWRAVTALISGVAAKETVISVIASLGGFEAVFDSRAAGVSFMIFTCLYVPCVATISALAKENGVKSALASISVHTLVAYAASLIYFNFARLYAYDKAVFWTVISCVAVSAAAVATVLYAFRRKRKCNTA